MASPGTFVPTAPLSGPSDDHSPPRPPSQHLKVPLSSTRSKQHAESSSVFPPVGVRGKLKPRLPFWEKDLKASPFVLDVIEHGYKIPFVTTPPPCCLKNNKSSLDHAEFVESAISDLLQNRCAVEVPTQPYCCNPLTVAEGKKLRLVLDLRHPNEFVLNSKFKYEDLYHISPVLGSGQFYFTFDLKSGYHHVDIFPPHRKFLGFSWRHSDNITRFYVFNVLPFGLNSACYLFTKLTRPLAYYWRSHGIMAYIYIDDGLIISPSLQAAESNLALVRNTISLSGFIPNEAKCVWKPSPRITYLGFIIDSPSSSFLIPQRKIADLLSLIEQLLASHNTFRSVSVKSLASFSGSIISMSLALGPITRLMTRATYHTIESRSSWACSLYLPSSVASELSFWQNHIAELNGFPFHYRLSPTMQIFSDASDTGFGGFVDGKPELRAHDLWSPSEKTYSSTWRELAAVLRILEAFGKNCHNQKIRWFTDNANVPSIIKRGSPKLPLQKLALAIFEYTHSRNIILLPQWLPREENKVADKISRYRDFDDWSIDPQSFLTLQHLWGPHTVDRFASPHNAKLPRFNTRFFCRGSAGVDAFCQDWSVDNNYLCPPVSLIPQVIKRMKESAVISTLVVPHWPSAHFWPLICPDGIHFDTHVHDWRLMHISFSPPSLGGSPLFCNNPRFHTLALRFDYILPPRVSDFGFRCPLPSHPPI